MDFTFRNNGNKDIKTKLLILIHRRIKKLGLKMKIHINLSRYKKNKYMIYL